MGKKENDIGIRIKIKNKNDIVLNEYTKKNLILDRKKK